MTTNVCREIINIISKYFGPIKAQFFVEKYCNKNKLSTEDFSCEDLPKFIIYLARDRDSHNNINDNKFERLLKELVNFSNIECNKNNILENQEYDENLIKI